MFGINKKELEVLDKRVTTIQTAVSDLKKDVEAKRAERIKALQDLSKAIKEISEVQKTEYTDLSNEVKGLASKVLDLDGFKKELLGDVHGKHQALIKIFEHIEERSNATSLQAGEIVVNSRQASEDIIKLGENFYKQLEEIRSRINDVEEIKRRMDDGIVLMKRVDILKIINDRLDILESAVDEKVVGLYRRVEERLSENNGNAKAISNFMRRIAVLENLKDKQEHRRSAQDVINMKANLTLKVMQLQREEKPAFLLEEKIQILNWVLGEQEEIK